MFAPHLAEPLRCFHVSSVRPRPTAHLKTEERGTEMNGQSHKRSSALRPKEERH